MSARGRTSSLNKQVPEPEPEPEPVQQKDYDASGCQYLGTFVPKTDHEGYGQETSDWGGTVYSGGFMNCLYHGEGQKIYDDGRIYEGEWAFGKPHGTGRFQFSNGTCLSSIVYTFICRPLYTTHSFLCAVML